MDNEEEKEKAIYHERLEDITMSLGISLRAQRLSPEEIFSVLVNVLSRCVAGMAIPIEDDKRSEFLNDIIDTVPEMLKDTCFDILKQFEEHLSKEEKSVLPDSK